MRVVLGPTQSTRGPSGAEPCPPTEAVVQRSIDDDDGRQWQLNAQLGCTQFAVRGHALPLSTYRMDFWRKDEKGQGSPQEVARRKGIKDDDHVTARWRGAALTC